MSWKVAAVLAILVVRPSFAQNCRRFSIAFVNPAPGFTVFVGEKVDVQLQINDCGGQPITSGSAVIDFSNKDPQLVLSHKGSGVWQGSWTPAAAVDGEADLTVFVASGGATDGNQVAGTVRPPAPPLTFDASGVVFETTAGASPVSQTVNVSSHTGVAQTVAITTDAGSWVEVSPASATIPAGGSLAINVKVDPRNLPVGLSPSNLTVTSGPDAIAKLRVSVSVSAPATPPQLTADTNAISLTLTQNDPAVTRSVVLTNSNETAVTVQAKTSSGWLTVTPPAGAVAPGSSLKLAITLSTNSLAPGPYSDAVAITTSAGQVITFPVALTVVAPPVPNPQLSADNYAFVFAASAGKAPDPQTLQLINPNAVPVHFQSSTFGFNSNFLIVTPRTGVVPANGQLSLQLVASADGENVGTDRGALTVLTDTGQALSFNAVLVVVPAGSGGSTCKPTRLFAAFTAPASGATVQVGQPVTIQSKVVTDCGTPLSPASAVGATFSNGDPPVHLSDAGGGVFTGIWTPVAFRAQTVVTVTAVDSGPSGVLLTEVDLYLMLVQRGPEPLLAQYIDAASFALGGPLAPGELIAIFGQNMADCTSAPGLPLPAQACGAQALFGGRAMPLFYVSPLQINAQVPFELPVDTVQQLVIQRGGNSSGPLKVAIAGAHPGIFTLSQQGSGQGAIFNNGTGQIADSRSPLTAGSALIIYCTGLGPVSPAVASGVPAPMAVLSSTVSPVSVDIGGVPAKVLFAGLAPGYIGLYQVNAIVPNGVAPGDNVAVALSAAGQRSPSVTVAVR
jgi:uncharacterized protein (TIGR03437 family)